MSRGLPRRAVLAGCALAPAVIRPARAAAERGALLVAGPAGGRLSAVAAGLVPALLRHLPPGTTLEPRSVGGADGVTGANQFQAWSEDDGDATPLLLLPGAAAAAWLAGDPRVRFDAARWLPLLCADGAGALVGRLPLDAPGSGPWRVAVPEPLGPAAACLLGLDLLGVAAAPSPEQQPAAAFAAGRVDAAYLPEPTASTGRFPPVSLRLFSVGRIEPGEVPPGAPAPPSLAALVDAAAAPDPALRRCLPAVLAAALLDFALVLPILTPAATVALWREAAGRAAAEPATFGPAARLASECTAMAALLDSESATLLTYRSWLAGRLDYRPA